MCGIVTALNVEYASAMCVAMAEARLQHRAQENAGATSTDGKIFREVKGEGLVRQVFSNVNVNEQLVGHAALLHLRYSTTGAPGTMENVQPFRWILPYHGELALAHNGNLTNYSAVAEQLRKSGCKLQSTSDSELFLPLIAKADDEDLMNAIAYMTTLVSGSYSLAILSHDALYLVRDPVGFRPLFFAPCGTGWIAASETNALDMFRTGECREVPAGTIIKLSAAGVDQFEYATAMVKPGRGKEQNDRVERNCSFEKYYYMRPDSAWGGSIDAFRKRVGAALAQRCKARGITGDLVTPVPDSATSFALGFSREAGIPFEIAIVRNHYFEGRTFILPEQLAREHAVDIKYGVIEALVRDKRIIVKEDSIVRFNTAPLIVRMLRKAGAKEVHLVVGFPPVVHPCHYGIDMKTMEELVANRMSQDEMCAFSGADTLTYLSVQECLDLLGDPHGIKHCTTCITRNPPLENLEIYQIMRRPAP